MSRTTTRLDETGTICGQEYALASVRLQRTARHLGDVGAGEGLHFVQLLDESRPMASGEIEFVLALFLFLALFAPRHRSIMLPLIELAATRPRASVTS